MEQCARFLASRENLFVASNNIHAVCALQNAPGIAVELAGGSVRMRDLDLIGMAAHVFFSSYRTDYAVFSCGGVSASGAVLDYNTDEVTARKAIANCGKTKVLVVDSTKHGSDLACQTGNVWDYDVVVSGARFSAPIVRNCEQHDCRLIRV